MAKFIKSGSYVPAVKAFTALDFFEKKEAWEEAGQTLLLLIERGLGMQLMRRFNCINNIFEHSQPELLKQAAQAMKPEVRKKFKMDSKWNV
jgi:hypothetical protein